jgi:hypothetical protein
MAVIFSTASLVSPMVVALSCQTPPKTKLTILKRVTVA